MVNKDVGNAFCLLENCGLFCWKPLSSESLSLSGRTNLGEGCFYTSQRGRSELWRWVLVDKDTVGLRVIIYRRPEAKELQIKYFKCTFWMAWCAVMQWVTHILLRPGQRPTHKLPTFIVDDACTWLDSSVPLSSASRSFRFVWSLICRRDRFLFSNDFHGRASSDKTDLIALAFTHFSWIYDARFSSEQAVFLTVSSFSVTLSQNFH